ncbi:MAG: hypothetical protein NZM18_03560 [Thermoflexales bacterium]|nr:hypothetical protein [Thermoflexales bacterium]MDW8350635.1 hypothetical protein [Anaerolineae bacterium]
MRTLYALNRRQLATIILASLIVLTFALFAFSRFDVFASDAKQPTPCPDSIACRALKRHDAVRATETAGSAP